MRQIAVQSIPKLQAQTSKIVDPVAREAIEEQASLPSVAGLMQDHKGGVVPARMNTASGAPVLEVFWGGKWQPVQMSTK